MKTLTLGSGLNIQILNATERAKLYGVIEMDINPVGKESQFTPHDNLEFFLVSEKEISNDKYEAVVRANSKEFMVRYNLYNQDMKIYSAVRKAFSV